MSTGNDAKIAIGRGLAFLEATQLPSGELPVQVSPSQRMDRQLADDASVFATALMVHSLSFARGSERICERALDFLEAEMLPLRDDATSFVQEIERRLGLSAHPPPVERVNAGLSSHELAWYPRLVGAVAFLPVGDRARGRVRRMLVRQIARGRLRNLVRRIDAVLSSAEPSMEIPVSLRDAWRGRAGRLVTDPLYGPYADEYRVK